MITEYVHVSRIGFQLYSVDATYTRKFNRCRECTAGWSSAVDGKTLGDALRRARKLARSYLFQRRCTRRIIMLPAKNALESKTEYYAAVDLAS